jgi:hypothetical protein
VSKAEALQWEHANMYKSCKISVTETEPMKEIQNVLKE